MRDLIRVVTALVLLVAMSTTVSLAQGTSGTIMGTVQDVREPFFRVSRSL